MKPGRLWDILTMLSHAIRSSKADGDTLSFQLYVRNDNRKPRLVTLTSVCGPDDDGAPCLTAMLPVADASLGAGRSFDERQARRFHLGELRQTPGATLALAENGVSPTELLARHARGDWGEVTDADRAANEAAIGNELRIWSVYRLPVTGEKIWVITEADRSATTIMLPDEY
jgi:hypothetical protein